MKKMEAKERENEENVRKKGMKLNKWRETREKNMKMAGKMRKLRNWRKKGKTLRKWREKEEN